MNQIQWIESDGGPLLLASKRAVQEWTGVHAANNINGVTDYERACAVQEEIDVIPIRSMWGVVLGDEPDRTGLFQGLSDLLLVRWRWAESEDSLLSVVRLAIDRLQFVASGIFTTQPGEHVLFDSACSASEIVKSINFILTSNKYYLETALLQPDKNICALIHRLRVCSE